MSLRYNSGVSIEPFEFAIDVAGPADVEEIAQLRALWSGGRVDAAFQRRLIDWIAAEGDRRLTWLARRDGIPIGMASLFEYRRMPRPGRLDSRWGYLGNMFVVERFRDHGVGTALLETVIRTAAGRGYARLVLSPSQRAVPFYRRAGFRMPDDAPDTDRLLVLRL